MDRVSASFCSLPRESDQVAEEKGFGVSFLLLVFILCAGGLGATSGSRDPSSLNAAAQDGAGAGDDVPNGASHFPRSPASGLTCAGALASHQAVIGGRIRNANPPRADPVCGRQTTCFSQPWASLLARLLVLFVCFSVSWSVGWSVRPSFCR